MERQVHQHLAEIRQSLLQMAGLVEAMIADAMRSLLERDDALAARVIEGDRDVDLAEVRIDDECRRVLATQQPTAVDLRLLVAVMKIVGELERIGDSAVNMAQGAQILNQEPPLKPYIDLPRLAELVRGMVRDSLDSLVNRSSDLALEVCARDDEVDGLYHQLFRELLTFMMEDPKTVSRALQILLMARNLERIADHATNVAEDVVYYVEGRDIRHSTGIPQ